jgi:hypothetical protein
MSAEWGNYIMQSYDMYSSPNIVRFRNQGEMNRAHE